MNPTSRRRILWAMCLAAVSAVAVLVFVLPVKNQRPTISNSKASTPTIGREEAAKIALEVTGFGGIGEIQTPELILLKDENIPFLSSQVNGMQAWSVGFKNVELMESEKFGMRDMYGPRNFTVVLNAETGQLIRISSKYDGSDPDMLPEPTAVTAEKEFGEGYEAYTGFPGKQPLVSFVAALNEVPVYKAKEILSVYVMQMKNECKPRPIWAITLRGIPLLRSGGRYEQIPKWERNHARFIISSESGRALGFTTIPQPDKPAELKTSPAAATDKKNLPKRDEHMDRVIERVKQSGERDPEKIKLMIEKLHAEEKARKSETQK